MPLDFTAILAEARERLAHEPADDDLLRFLRDRGATMLESVKLIRELRAISLGDAQDLVHNSPVWADYYESHQALQDDFARALLEIGGKVEDI